MGWNPLTHMGCWLYRFVHDEFFQYNSVLSSFCAKKRPRCKIWTEHKCDTSDRQILAARWIGSRRHHIRMRRCRKTHYRRKQYWLAVHCFILLAGTSLVLFIVSWKIGFWWEYELVRLLCQDLLSSGEAISRPNTFNACIAEHGCLRARLCGDTANVIIRFLEMNSLSSPLMWLTWSQTITLWDRSAHTAAQTQSNEEKHNFFVTRAGGRARLREAHSDVPFCVLQHTELATREQTCCGANEKHKCHFTDGGGRGSLKSAHSDVPFSIHLHASAQHEKAHITSIATSHKNFPQLQPDVRAAEHPTDHHDNANDSTRQESSRSSIGWKFCTMNMTSFSTQHLAIFALMCHV